MNIGVRFRHILSVVLCMIAMPAVAAFDPAVALRASQAAVGKALPDFTLLDREGRPVRLSHYRGKPLLVSFIYTGCFQVCPATTRVLLDAVKQMQARFGANQFNVISIGFNQPADSPQALKSFAIQNGINYPNWEFLSPHISIVNSLTDNFGFTQVATAAGFDHLLQLTLVDAQGKIYRQIYGDNLSGDILGEPLRQLLSNTPVAESVNLSSIIDKVRILCTVYDPVSGEYRIKDGLILEIAGGLTFLLAVLWFFLLEWRNRKASAKKLRPVRLE